MRNYIFKIFIIIIGALAFNSCKHSDMSNDYPIIRLDKSDEIKKIDLSAITSEYKILKPETTSESLISKIRRVWNFKSYIYILDYRNQILVFDNSTGKYSWKLCNIGNGPGEYSRLIDFAIDEVNDQILLLDYGKIIRYDLKGNYIDFINSGDAYEISTDGKYAYLKCFDEENEIANRYSLKIVDLETSAVTDALPVITNCAPSCSSDMRTLTYSDGKVFLSRKFDDKIYSLSNKSVNTLFNIDFGEYTFPNISDKKYDCNEFFRIARENNYIFCLGDVVMSDSLGLFKTNLNSYGLINKDANTIELAKNITNLRLFPDVAPPLKSIPVDGNLPEIAIVIQPSNANFFASICSDSIVATILSSMEETDNPLLIFSVLK